MCLHHPKYTGLYKCKIDWPFSNLEATKMILHGIILCTTYGCEVKNKSNDLLLFCKMHAHKPDEEQGSTDCTCWILYALVKNKKNTITRHSKIITRKTSLNSIFFSFLFWTWIIQCPKPRIALRYVFKLPGGTQFQILWKWFELSRWIIMTVIWKQIKLKTCT